MFEVEVPQQVKASAIKPSDLSSIPRTWWMERNNFCKLSSDLHENEHRK